MTKQNKKELDKLWQQVIHSRDKFCQVCHKQEGLNAHHIFTRSRMNTRFDCDNGILLCTGCHIRSSLLSAHKAPLAFFRWLEFKKGKEFVDALEIRSQMIAKNLDFKLLQLYLTNELKKYE